MTQEKHSIFDITRDPGCFCDEWAMGTNLVIPRSQQADKTGFTEPSIPSILIYASETWSISKSLEKGKDGFDLHALCTTEVIKWPNKISNPELCKCTQQLQVSKLIVRSRLCWLGHLLWCASSQPALECYHFELRSLGGRDLEVSPTLTGDLSTRKMYKRCAKTVQHWRRLCLTAGSGN